MSRARHSITPRAASRRITNCRIWFCRAAAWRARAADYLRSCLTQQATVIDFFSLLYSCLLVQAAGGPDVLSEVK